MIISQNIKTRKNALCFGGIKKKIYNTHSVVKREFYSCRKNISWKCQIATTRAELVSLISREFYQNIARANFCNYHTVQGLVTEWMKMSKGRWWQQFQNLNFNLTKYNIWHECCNNKFPKGLSKHTTVQHIRSYTILWMFMYIHICTVYNWKIVINFDNIQWNKFWQKIGKIVFEKKSYKVWGLTS